MKETTTIDGVEYRLPRCCTPVWGEAVFGFLTRGRGISLHSEDCINAGFLRRHRERLVDVEWPGERRGGARTASATFDYFSVPICLECSDSSGLIAKISEVVTDRKSVMTELHVLRSSIGQKIVISVDVVDLKHLTSVREGLSEVGAVRRILAKGRGEEFSDVIFEAVETETSDALIKPLILQVNSHLVMLAHQRPGILRDLTPRLFEEFVAELFNGFGYEVELTAQSRDGGRDVVAIRRHDDILLKFLIECKFFAPPEAVGVGYVRQLLGVKYDEGASKAILATTTTFSKPARELEERHIYELELRDYAGIIEWVGLYSRMKPGP